jgi:molybdate transport system regulatory protein
MTRAARRPPRASGLRIRLVFEDGAMIGPGKADLLAAIRETGSIAAAGRRLGMSYKRAWLLVETLNAMFATPLVESARGGADHGGAALTPAGAAVRDRYRRLEAAAGAAAAPEIAALRGLRPDRAGET